MYVSVANKKNDQASKKVRTYMTPVSPSPFWPKGSVGRQGVCCMFKAAPDGPVIQRLRKSSRLKPWMHVQVQKNGSYRSEDVRSRSA